MMEKWEYLTVELEPIANKKMLRTSDKVWTAELITGQLNVHGQEGWELVACIRDYEVVNITNIAGHDTRKIFAMFKRKMT